MKSLYITIVLVLITATTSAQPSTVNSNKVITNNDESVAQTFENSSNTDLEFRYYYFPNLCAYYDLETNNYIFKVNNQWETSSELPQYYGGYSTFKNARIPLKDYIGDNPQEKLNEHKKQFPYIKKSRMLKTLNIDQNTAVSTIN
jgi:hypothetical protein